MNRVQNNQVAVRYCIINMKFKRVPSLAFSQINGVNEESFVIWVATFSPTIIMVFQLVKQPINHFVVRCFC